MTERPEQCDTLDDVITTLEAIRDEQGDIPVWADNDGVTIPNVNVQLVRDDDGSKVVFR